jgi:hypothetical protein
MSTIGVVAGGAGGVETLRTGLVQPLLDDGHIVAITLTPTAATWLAECGEVDALQRLTGLPVRSEPRLPGVASPHPYIDVFIAAPLTANSVAKLALGIADNQALTVLCESIATTPMIVFPRQRSTRPPAGLEESSRQFALSGRGPDLRRPRVATGRTAPSRSARASLGGCAHRCPTPLVNAPQAERQAGEVVLRIPPQRRTSGAFGTEVCRVRG